MPTLALFRLYGQTAKIDFVKHRDLSSYQSLNTTLGQTFFFQLQVAPFFLAINQNMNLWNTNVGRLILMYALYSPSQLILFDRC